MRGVVFVCWLGALPRPAPPCPALPCPARCALSTPLAFYWLLISLRARRPASISHFSLDTARESVRLHPQNRQRDIECILACAWNIGHLRLELCGFT